MLIFTFVHVCVHRVKRLVTALTLNTMFTVINNMSQQRSAAVLCRHLVVSVRIIPSLIFLCEYANHVSSLHFVFCTENC